MSAGQQANAVNGPPAHHKGVVVDFPAPHLQHTVPAPPGDPDLPVFSPLTSQARPQDNWNACSAEERTWKVQKPLVAEDAVEPGAVPCLAASFEQPSGQTEATAAVLRNSSERAVESVPSRPNTKQIKPKRGWLERWLNPEPSDKRRVARETTPGLIARFWNGGPPQAHTVRDISASGLYVVTEERWYLGTQILITLTKPARGKSQAESTITMHAVAVRHGSDGVGLEFILNDPRNRRPIQPSFTQGGNGDQLAQFMQHVRSGDLKQENASH
jgi:PilZ domain